MSPLTLSNDALVAIPVAFTDQVGLPIAVPGPIAASSSNPPGGTAVIGANGCTLDLTPVSNGDDTVTVSRGALSASFDVSIADPAATSIRLDLDKTVFTPMTAPAPSAWSDLSYNAERTGPD